MFKAGGVLSGGDKSMEPEYVSARMTTGDFFPMFETPFLYGGGWNAKADEGPEPVIVLSKETNQKAFGGANSVGKTVLLARPRIPRGRRARRLGAGAEVLRRINGSFDDAEGDLRALRLGPDPGTRQRRQHQLLEDRGHRRATRTSSTPNASGSRAGWSCARRPRCAPIASSSTTTSIEQKSKGRFPRPLNNHLYNIEGWMQRNKVVGTDNKAMLIMAFAFLAVCLVNTVGLLLAKFLNAAPVAGVRRALGASRRDIFWQHLTESGVVAVAGGIAGGLLGVARRLGAACLVWALRAGPRSVAADRLQHVRASRWSSRSLAGIIAGLYPAWRIGRAAPASYLKVQ